MNNETLFQWLSKYKIIFWTWVNQEAQNYSFESNQYTSFWFVLFAEFIFLWLSMASSLTCMQYTCQSYCQYKINATTEIFIAWTVWSPGINTHTAFNFFHSKLCVFILWFPSNFDFDCYVISWICCLNPSDSFINTIYQLLF